MSGESGTSGLVHITTGSTTLGNSGSIYVSSGHATGGVGGSIGIVVGDGDSGLGGTYSFVAVGYTVKIVTVKQAEACSLLVAEAYHRLAD